MPCGVGLVLKTASHQLIVMLHAKLLLVRLYALLCMLLISRSALQVADLSSKALHVDWWTGTTILLPVSFRAQVVSPQITASPVVRRCASVAGGHGACRVGSAALFPTST